MATQVDASAFQRLITSFAASFDRAGLESLIGYRADQQTQDLVDQLAEKSNAGTLTDEEQREYGAFVETSRFIAVLKAEAKRILESQNAA